MNKCKIIAVANQKGGTGKTTTASNMGTALAHEGKRVLLVDFDPQANLTMSFGIEQPDELAMPMHSVLSLVMDGQELPQKGAYFAHVIAAGGLGLYDQGPCPHLQGWR